VELQKRVSEGEARLKQQQAREQGPRASSPAAPANTCTACPLTRPSPNHDSLPPRPHPAPASDACQALYEAVRADRNLYSKTLIEAQDEINELKRKAKITTHQVGGRQRGPACGI
jgi:hypothetical protein